MGGKAFGTGSAFATRSKALLTPRMIPEVYSIALRRATNALKPFFPHARLKSPLEAPEKTSFGDIDIILSLEGSSFAQPDIDDPEKSTIWTAIQKELGAVYVFQDNDASLSKSFAVKWPNHARLQTLRSQQDIVLEEAPYKAESEDKQWYVQIDVRICKSIREFEWRVFVHDHGDMWSILGTIIRPYGLTATDEGLFIRIPELEKRDKKKARVFLTDSPAETLQFIISDNNIDEWTQRFPSVDAMFAFAARCKWYGVWLAHESEKLRERDDNNAAKFKDALEPTDRQRTKQRPLYARWVDEHVPAQLAAAAAPSEPAVPTAQQPTAITLPPTPTPAQVRTAVRALAFAAFPGADARYAQQLAAWSKEQARIFVKNTLIKRDQALPESVASALPAPREGASAAGLETSWRGALRGALVKIIVVDGDGESGVEAEEDDEGEGHSRIVAPACLRDEGGVLVVDEVRRWIGNNWARVGRAAWAEQCARAREAFRAKEERRLAAGGEGGGVPEAECGQGA